MILFLQFLNYHIMKSLVLITYVLKRKPYWKKLWTYFFEDSIMLAGVNEGHFCTLRWRASSPIFAVDCEVGRGADPCWKSAGRGARESIPYSVPRGPGYVLYLNVSGYMSDILFIWKIKPYDNSDTLCITKGKKSKNQIHIYMYKYWIRNLIVSTLYGRLIRAGLRITNELTT